MCRMLAQSINMCNLSLKIMLKIKTKTIRSMSEIKYVIYSLKIDISMTSVYFDKNLMYFIDIHLQADWFDKNLQLIS